MKKILIVAGGTGGHLFPAIVFGKWLKASSVADVTFMTGSRSLEKDILEGADITPFYLPVAGSPLGVRKISSKLSRMFALLRAFFVAWRHIAKLSPDGCCLFGGYVSLVPLLICRLLSIPVIAHEQNVVAGKVTRVASFLGVPILSGWSECSGIRNFTHVGIPVRKMKKMDRLQALSFLGETWEEGMQVVGMIGGSLGSKDLIRSVALAAERLCSKPALSRVVFLCLGHNTDGEVPSNMHFLGTLWDMAPFYSACDLLICRAGASTLAEALHLCIPTISIPWQDAADGHQECNARHFANHGGYIWHPEDDEALDELIEKLLLEERCVKDTCSHHKDICLGIWNFMQPLLNKVLPYKTKDEN